MLATLMVVLMLVITRFTTRVTRVLNFFSFISLKDFFLGFNNFFFVVEKFTRI